MYGYFMPSATFFYCLITYGFVFLSFLKKFHGQLKPSVTLEAALNERTENQQNDQLAIVFNKEGGMDLLITLILSYVPYDSLSKAKFGYEKLVL